MMDWIVRGKKRRHRFMRRAERLCMCTIMEDLRKDTEIQIALNLLHRGRDSVKEIAEITGLPMEKVKELATKAPANGWSSL